MTEEWRPVAGWEGVYAVSYEGRVLRLIGNRPDGGYSGRCKRGVPMRPRLNSKGYERVDLRHQGRIEVWFVHHLVANAFIGPRPDGLVIAHNDGDPRNNRAANLRYCTGRENEADKKRHGTFNHAGPPSSLTDEQVASLRERFVPYSRKDGAAAMARELGVAANMIQCILAGRSRREMGGGFKART